jgi:hypothetical protein
MEKTDGKLNELIHAISTTALPDAARERVTSTD